MKVVFIIPYYGTFPNYFNLFLKTCGNNPGYEWFIFSEDNGKYNYPGSVHYVEMPWQELKSLFQSKFDFEISLDSPYKLCDYRPAYGYIFEEYIKDYDYWGYCDIDLLFGDLNHFIPPEKIKDFDKVGHLGHMTLYKNCTEVNRLFMSEMEGVLRYKEVFTSNQPFVFDEWNWISINHIFLNKKKTVWMFDAFFDIYPYDDNFRKVVREIPAGSESYGRAMIEKKPSFASVEKGKAYQWRFDGKRWVKTEAAYVHFQKRAMQFLVEESADRVLCVPDQFLPFEGEDIPEQYVKEARRHRFLNQKKFSWEKKKIVYWIIEKSSPIRHPFQRRKR